MRLKRTLIIFSLALFFTLFFAFIDGNQNILLSFINTSFYISGSLLFLFLFLFVNKGGFFDSITDSFRRLTRINGSYISAEERAEMKKPSDLVSFDILPIFFAGLVLFILMLIALLYFYR